MKYNWTVIGNEPIKEFLINLIESDQRPHAFLFYGKAGVGKEKILRQFIRILQCQAHHRANNTYAQIEQLPCDVCEYCQQSNDPDIYTIRREFDEKTEKLKQNISIGQIRHLQAQLQKGAFLGGYNCGIIYESQYLSEQAANSLLKILEEPPQQTLLILHAESVEKIPKTVLSRCQLLQVQPVATNEIFKHLCERGVPERDAQNYAHMSNGAVEYAIQLIDDTDAKNAYNQLIGDSLKLLNSPLHERLKVVEDRIKSVKGMTAQSELMQRWLEVFDLLLRDMLLLRVDAGQFCTHYLLEQQLQGIAQQYTQHELVQLIDLNKKMRELLQKNSNPQLVLENLAITIKN